MRAALVQQGGPRLPDIAKARRWGITRLFFEARDPALLDPTRVPVNVLQWVKAQGMGVGVMREPSWTGKYGATHAEELSNDLTRFGFGPTTGPDSCAALSDDEKHFPSEILPMLTRFRELRRTRTFLWSPEPMQGGWVDDDPALVDFIQNDVNLKVIVQLYLGTPRLYPVSERVAVDNLKAASIDDSRIACFYDTIETRVPWGWNGILYSFNHLPDSPPVGL